MVPEQLMDHPIAEFMHKNCFTEQTGPVKVYYHRNDFPIGMHSHSFYEINIVDRGTGRHYIESHSCAASAGCVFVLPPEIRHGYWETSGLSIFHILLSCTYMERWQEELRALPGYPTLFEIEPMLRQERRDNLFLTLDSARLAGLIPELDALLELEHSTYPGASAIKCARTFALIGTLCQAVSAQYSAALQKPQQASAVLMQSMEYIHQNFCDKLSIDALAQRAQMSRSSFLRGFHRLAGCSPIQYQMQCRITCAKELMCCTDSSITRISQDCGFYDVSQFGKLFLRAEGICPRKYRLQHKTR